VEPLTVKLHNPRLHLRNHGGVGGEPDRHLPTQSRRRAATEESELRIEITPGPSNMLMKSLSADARATVFVKLLSEEEKLTTTDGLVRPSSSGKWAVKRLPASQ
jgi:hypothetical protein